MQNELTRDPNQAKAFKFDLGIVYHVIFRHKWKILICALSGLVAALCCRISIKPVYHSRAKLMIRYVLESKSGPVGVDAQTKSPDPRGDSIMGSEKELLNSLDLMKQVATNLGPKRILAAIGGGENAQAAASVLHSHLEVVSPKFSTLLYVSFRHPDPEVPQAALVELINVYKEFHQKIHGISVADAYLIEMTDKYRSALRNTDAQLKDERQKAGILYEADATNVFQQIVQLNAEIHNTKLDIRTREELLSIANGEVSSQDGKQEPLTPEQQEKIETYQNVVRQIGRTQAYIDKLLERYVEDSPPVTNATQQLKDLKDKRRKMEREDSKLTAVSVAPDPAGKQAFKAGELMAEITQLQVKLKVLNEQHADVMKKVETLEKVMPGIKDLIRRRDFEDANYQYLITIKTQSGYEDIFKSISNIVILENATPPFRDDSQINKALIISLASGLGLGILLALLSEFLLDQTVKRPGEVEGPLNMSLFLSIPNLRSGKHVRVNSLRPMALLGQNGNDVDAPTSNRKANGHGRMDELEAGLRPFFGALRDRTIMYLERLTHKPKLIAVTGCSEDSGVTTIATGLAKALSETAEGRVLLVDMTREFGATHPFLNGKPVCGLADALEHDKRQSGQIQDNLYVATTAEQNDQALSVLPKRFAALVPKLKASDYDYVIFDMPPVNPLSITPRLAGLMDIVLLVVESEKSRRNSVQRATSILSEAKANVRAVLNKQRNYVPKWLYEES